MRKLFFLCPVFFLAFTPVVFSQAGDRSPVYESKPQELTIYEGNLALAGERIPVHPADIIQISLPASVVPRSIEIIDGGVNIGEFSFIPAGTVSPGTDSLTSGTPLIKWKSKNRNSREVTLKYLMSGLKWSPSYSMQILPNNKVKFKYNISINNNVAQFQKVGIRLISGMVGQVSELAEGGVYLRKCSEAQVMSGEGRIGDCSQYYQAPDVGAVRVNAYYSYDLSKSAGLEKGMNYFCLFDKELDVKKEFVWLTSAGEKVDLVYSLTNSSEQPFSVGIVDSYQDGIYMGSDHIEWTPAKAEGHITIGSAVDIRVEKSINVTEIPERNHNDEFHHEAVLKISNFSKEAVEIKVIDHKYPDCVDIAFSMKPKEEKNQAYIWQVSAEPGKVREIKYDFYSDNSYNEPYRKYW